MNDFDVSTKETLCATSRGDEINRSVDLLSEARDYAVVVSLACSAQLGGEAGAVMRLAHKIVDCMNMAEDLLEADLDRGNGRAAE